MIEGILGVLFNYWPLCEKGENLRQSVIAGADVSTFQSYL